ncbi:MAG: cystathionine gamma-synthase [Acidimicrobiales bacterium]
MGTADQNADEEGRAGQPDDLGFETRAIHAGQPPDPQTGAVTVPIGLATTFAQPTVGAEQAYEYARSGNPTRAALEACVASLEGATSGFAFSSGLAAEDAVLRSQLGPGDHLLLGNDAYGGTLRLIARVLAPTGVTWTAVDLTDPGAVEAAWTLSTRLVWVETPTNPLLMVVDIGAVAEAAHERGGICVVDNTFATPYLQRPLARGADIVVHSSTKYLGGHSDVVGGFVAVSDPYIAEVVGFLQNAVGAVPGPFDCYLVMRGIKTLGVRMDRHCANAAAVADLLVAHPAVASVRYPGLAGHPGHEVAVCQMSGFGGMVSFVAAGGAEAARAVAERTRVFTLAESLGAVESLIEIPAAMTHQSTAGTALEVDPALVRLSVGIETLDDILADLEQALDG